MTVRPVPNSVRRLAVLRLHLPNGEVLSRQVVEERGGKYLRHYPLVEELPHTPWLRGDYYLTPTAVTYGSTTV